MDTVSADRYAELHRAHRWDVPRDFNVAHACCRRWASDRARFALYWEDESGERNAWTFFDLQQQANRLSNALVAMGAARGDRISLIFELPALDVQQCVALLTNLRQVAHVL